MNKRLNTLTCAKHSKVQLNWYQWYQNHSRMCKVVVVVMMNLCIKVIELIYIQNRTAVALCDA